MSRDKENVNSSNTSLLKYEVPVSDDGKDELRKDCIRESQQQSSSLYEDQDRRINESSETLMIG